MAGVTVNASRNAVGVRADGLPWLLALVGFALDLAAYWPGQMSFDSAYAWWQARGGDSTDIVPPAFVLVWRACDALLDGPGLLFALHLALFWSGLALLMHALRMRAATTAAAMLLVAFVPASWLLRGHVWTDVGLFSALAFATGALANAQLRRARTWLFVALPALFYAAALRHNALPALLPFAGWFAWLAVTRDRRASRIVVTSFACALLGGMLVTNLLLAQGVRRHVPLWISLAQFDLAAISIETDHMLLPDFMIGQGLDVPELAQAFRTWGSLAMLINTRHGMRSPFETDFTHAERTTLRRAWFDAIAQHPLAWLAHRGRFSAGLFGTHPDDWPRELIYVDGEAPYRDNPAVAPNTSALHAALMRAASALATTPLLAAWPYLTLGLVALPLAWRRRGETNAVIALLLLASAWAYALPLTVLAPSTELRYLGWPCIASLLALACLGPKQPASTR